ncbi:acyl-CoA thiolase [Pseudooceanicola aestuarii]|uniref:thiolase family protein n=1 Tax=Pseudooceanicola aestuarii TaxID=2697319 RepID=UPI0013D7BFB9|nr:acyl-CoA thiolase [Pseudooceanicola aestuarii]
MDVLIYEALRGPRGKARPDGGLASATPQGLVADLASGIADRTGAAPDPCALVLGAVGQVGAQGGNIAQVAKLAAGLPARTATISVNNFCVSGLTAVGQAAAMVQAGTARSALAGGVEMMSRVPFMGDRAEYYTDDSFAPPQRYIPVALAADRLAARRDVTRAELDAAALTSGQRAVAAEGTALTASRLALNGLEREECLRPVTAEGLAGLEPVFGPLAEQYRDALGDEEFAPIHTLAHAPATSDGAALALMGAPGAVEAAPRARILAWAETGGDIGASLTAGVDAMDQVLERAGLRLQDMDRIEFMEAFAVTQALFLRDRAPDPDRVNVGGGHLAKGHPLGASGAILLSSLLDALDACQGRLGLVVATGAQGAGSAMIVERLNRG